MLAVLLDRVCQYYLAITEEGLTITAWDLPDPERDLPRPLPVLRERNVNLLHVIFPVIGREETTEETANIVKDLSSLSAVGILHLNIRISTKQGGLC